MSKTYYTYILASKKNGTLYIGVTNDLIRRVREHKGYLIPGFTSKYKVGKLIYFEEFPDAYQAISREKQLKGWRRSKKIDLITKLNPSWLDLDPSASSGRQSF